YAPAAPRALRSFPPRRSSDLVDLDAAFGRGSNRELLHTVVAKLDVKVEMSGGIRDDASLEAAMATGCARVNIGTAALENPQWCRSEEHTSELQSRGHLVCRLL